MRAQGYPLAKAQAYERLRNPFMLNDLAMAPLLLDRRDVYTRLGQFDSFLPTSDE